MDEEGYQRERRRERQYERLGTRTPRCPCCGETHPACFEGHHIAGRQYDPTTILVCASDHRKLTDMQKDHPMFDPDADPFLQSLAHFLWGLADMLVLAAEKLKEFAAGLLQRARNGSTGQMEVK